jgi:HlyD family secretion protein
MPTGRIVTLALVAVAIIGGLAWGFRPRPLGADTVEVTRQTLRITVEEEGRTRVKDRYVVTAPVDGYARRIELDVGDAIEPGQPLVELEPVRSRVLDPRSRAEAEARVAGARSSLARSEAEARRAEAQADQAMIEYQRQKALRERELIAQSLLDEAESVMRATRAAVRAAESAVDVARYELDAALTALNYSAASPDAEPMETVLVTSPVGGRILKRVHESEGLVSGGQALLEIGDPTLLEVEVDVLSKDAVRITPGGRVLLERWGGDAPLQARVRTVEPTGFTKISALGVEEQRVLVIADIVSPPEEWTRLGDGYRVEARFVVWEQQNVLQAPTSALFRRNDGWAVFVAEAGRARLASVRTGRSNGLQTEVLDGLEAGMEVIVHPDEAIEDGSRIAPFRDGD